MLKLVRRISTAISLGLLLLFVLVPAALADTVTSSGPLVFDSKQTWALIIGSLVPLVTYVLNHVGPWVTEPAKAFVLVVVSGLAGGLYEALSTSSFGWNSASVQVVLTSIFAALAAHHLLWKPAGVSTMLGAGSNSTHRRLAWVNETNPPAPPAQ